MNSVATAYHESPAASSVVRYDPAAIALHWTMAVLIAFLGSESLLSGVMRQFGRGWWTNLHIEVGVALAVLLVGRVAWRIMHRPPELPHDTTRLVRTSAHAVHLLLYATTASVVIFGLLAVLARGHGIDLGIVQIPSVMPANRGLARSLNHLHGWSATIMLSLAGLHMLAAIWHHFIARDTILLRMWPARGQ